MTANPAPNETPVPVSRYGLFGALCFGGCLLDLFTKSWIFGRLGMPGDQPPWWIIPGAFCLETSLNEGALFGVGQGKVWLFAALAIVAILVVGWWLFIARAANSLLLTFALGVISGGILGNLYDRVGLPGLKWNYGNELHLPGDRVFAVRDWLHVRIDAIGFDFAIFNLADSFLVCGVGLFILQSFLAGPSCDGARAPTSPNCQDDNATAS